MHLLLNYFLLLYSAGRDVRGLSEINPFVKTRWRSAKTAAKRKLCLLSGNPLVKNVVSTAQNCSKTFLLCLHEAGRPMVDRFIHFCARRSCETQIVTFWDARRCSATRIFVSEDVSPLAAFSVSTARNCSETQILSSRNCSVSSPRQEVPPEGGQILPWGAAAEAADTGSKVDKDAVEAAAQAVQAPELLKSYLMSITFQ